MLNIEYSYCGIFPTSLLCKGTMKYNGTCIGKDIYMTMS